MIRYSAGIIALLFILIFGTISVLLTNGHIRLSDGKIFEKKENRSDSASGGAEAASSISNANTVSTQSTSPNTKPAKLSLEAVYNKCDDTGNCSKRVAGKFSLKSLDGTTQTLTTNTLAPTEVSLPAGVYILSVDDVSVEGARVVLAPATITLKDGATTKVSVSLTTK